MRSSEEPGTIARDEDESFDSTVCLPGEMEGEGEEEGEEGEEGEEEEEEK
jgi:hypothetical protein